MHRDSKAPGSVEGAASSPERAKEFLILSQGILSYSNHGPTRIAFLKEISGTLLDFSGCDEIELRHRSDNIHYRWRMSRGFGYDFHFEIIPQFAAQSNTLFDKLCIMALAQSPDPRLKAYTIRESLVIDDIQDLFAALGGEFRQAAEDTAADDRQYRSLVLVPFAVNDENYGIVIFKSREASCIYPGEIEFLEGVAQTIGLASVNRRAQESLRERVKELTCLYGIAQIAEDTGLNLETKLQRIVNLLPPAWHYPDIAVARIDVNGHTFLTPGYSDGRYQQKVDIVIYGNKRGSVEVAYIAGRPELVEGPFLKEEFSLILEVARQIASIIEREEMEDHKARLEEQLRHADRLATIGRLAAGVAHELNEPLSGILGFAQLAKKNLESSEQVGKDLDRIINTSLHAREIVRKLLIFARQMPPQKTEVNLNMIVGEALSLFDTRCSKEGIAVVRDLSDDLPAIEADPVQMNQLVVNLVVNAIQAMPQGGMLTVQTTCDADSVMLIVEDTGVGMTAEVKGQIFTPFYTTKDVKQGTGLGLSVVHGIVTSHGGSVDVKTSIGKGSRFEVRLPLPGTAGQ